MPSGSNAWQRSLQAAEAAGQLLNELGVEPTRQINVFSMCEDAGLWLTFMPMDGLLGAFIPEGSGGVLITDRRPITVQRYTAAHELGHWRLEHGGLALDDDEFVFGTTSVERERLAQVFAANLLMPAPLVLSLLARIGASADEPLTPRETYFVARETGVSYEAAVRQLRNLDLVTDATATALLAVRPLVVKSELAGGRRPVYGYADVWPVDEGWNDQILTVRADDEVVVSLPENRTTGYRWMFEDETTEAPSPTPPQLAPQPDNSERASVHAFIERVRTAEPQRVPGAALERARHVPEITSESDAPDHELPGGLSVVGDAYQPGRSAMLRPLAAQRARLAAIDAVREPWAANLPSTMTVDEVLIGATGRRLLGVRFTEPGPKTLRLKHRSPYSSAPPIEEYVLHAVVEPRRHGFSIDQLLEDPDNEWADDVRERKLHESVGDIDEPGNN